MTLPEWLAYLESLHPKEIELGLGRIRQVAERLPLDFSQQKVACIGGTNGKGSSVNLISSILQTRGHQVGAYTSPHLVHYNERVCINNIPVSDEDLCNAFAQVETARETIQLTYFEFGTLAALVLFSQSSLDYILLEVGLGGRLDAVNILEADLSLLTNVAIDHTDWLGDTREAIGAEKAGIYKQGRYAIYGEEDMPDSVLRAVEKVGANLYRKGHTFDWAYDSPNDEQAKSWHWSGRDTKGEFIEYTDLPTKGFALDHAINNIAGAIQAVTLLDEDISRENVILGMQQASLAGRFQIVEREGHSLILDVAHNPHAAQHLLSNLQTTFPNRKVRIVIAMLEDKDIAKVLKILQAGIYQWYVAEIKEDRGSPAKILYNHLQEMGENNLSCFDEISEAFAAAESDSKPNDIVLVTGSFFTVSTVLELI